MLREAHRLEDITKAVRTKAAVGIRPKRSWSQDKRDAAFCANILVMVIGHHSSAYLCKMIDAGAGQTLAIMTSSLLLQRLTSSVNGLLASLGPWRM
jgi:hypothetical protein